MVAQRYVKRTVIGTEFTAYDHTAEEARRHWLRIDLPAWQWMAGTAVCRCKLTTALQLYSGTHPDKWKQSFTEHRANGIGTRVSGIANRWPGYEKLVESFWHSRLSAWIELLNFRRQLKRNVREHACVAFHSWLHQLILWPCSCSPRNPLDLWLATSLVGKWSL